MPQTRANTKETSGEPVDTGKKANTKDTGKKAPAATKAPTKAATKAPATKAPATKAPATKAPTKAATKAAEKAAAKAVAESSQIKRLSQIATLENKNAAAHANEATPGGPYNETPKKDQKKKKARKPVIVESSDVEPMTDVEGTVRQKAKKGGPELRGAIQALRQQKLDLTPVDETNEESGGEVDETKALEPAEETHENEELGAGAGDVQEAEIDEPGNSGGGLRRTDTSPDVEMEDNRNCEHDKEDFMEEGTSTKDVGRGTNPDDEDGEVQEADEGGELEAEGVAELKGRDEHGQKGAAKRKEVDYHQDNDTEMDDITGEMTQLVAGRRTKRQRQPDSDGEEGEAEQPLQKKKRAQEAPPTKGKAPGAPSKGTTLKPSSTGAAKRKPNSKSLGAKGADSMEVDDDGIVPSEKARPNTLAPARDKTTRENTQKMAVGAVGDGKRGQLKKDRSPMPSLPSEQPAKSSTGTSMKAGSRSSSSSSHLSGASRPHSVPSKSRPQQNEEKFEPDNTNSDDSSPVGGLSDHGEKDGDERRAAKESPAKGKRRLDSKHLTEVQADEKNSGSQSKARNEDLPQELMINNRWTKKIIPSLICYCAAQDNPWSIKVPKILDALEIIGQYYAGSSYQLEDGTESAEYSLASQRLSDTWRTPIRTMALKVVNAFFNEKPDHFGTDTARQKWAKIALKSSRFLYSDARSKNPKAWTGIFRNKLFLRTFVAHLVAIKGSSWVEGLSYPLDEHPRGALALSAAALEWSITLWEKEYIDIKKVLAANGGTIKFDRQRNNRGNETKSYIAFTYGDWGTKTLNYLTSVNALSSEAIEDIIEECRKYIPKGRNTRARHGDDEDDPRAHLMEGDASAGEDDSDLEGVPGWSDAEEDSAPPLHSKVQPQIRSDSRAVSNANGKSKPKSKEVNAS